MRRVPLVLILTVGLCMTGCGRQSQPVPTPKHEPGAPGQAQEGASGKPNKVSIPSIRPSDTASLSVKSKGDKPISVAKGKPVTARIVLERNHYTGAVTVTISPPEDKGVEIKPTEFTMTANESTHEVTITATATVQPSTVDVPLQASGADHGPSATGHLSVKVE